MTNTQIIDAIGKGYGYLPPHEELARLIGTYNESDRAYAAEKARGTAEAVFGKKVFFRGIIEFTNICKNDCLYCGLQRSNSLLSRYRLGEEDILSCCETGHALGYRTFVLQGGEDGYFNDDRMCGIVSKIREKYPDCAITLSLGERNRASYQRLFDAGANRYLLRHESATKDHYDKLHPSFQSFDARMRCLFDLRDIGYQTGCGMMVGSPFQTADDLARDLEFMAGFDPQMAGIGPFIPHKDTPFRDFPSGSEDLTLFLLSLTRIMLPHVLLPATTALGTLAGNGRQLGVLAGCNVVMPNLSPLSVRSKYLLYNGKAGTHDDAAASIRLLSDQMREIGYEVSVSRGDYCPAVSKS